MVFSLLTSVLLLVEPPSIHLPAEVRVAPGRLLRLHADTVEKHVAWALASEGADLEPFPDAKTAVIVAPRPGRYLVLAWTARGDVPSAAARCWVIVAEPDPGPAADPLIEQLQKLYAADNDPEKAGHLAQLAVLYREAVGFAARAEVRTVGELADRIRQAGGTLLPASALVEVRKRIAEELSATLPGRGQTPLDETTRQAAAKVFERIGMALEALR